jgi:hypothetical protein
MKQGFFAPTSWEGFFGDGAKLYYPLSERDIATFFLQMIVSVVSVVSE